MECPSQEGLTDEEKHGGLLFSVCLARLRTPSRARPLVRVSGEKLTRPRSQGRGISASPRQRGKTATHQFGYNGVQGVCATQHKVNRAKA